MKCFILLVSYNRCISLEWDWLFTRSWCIQRCAPCTKSLWTSSTWWGQVYTMWVVPPVAQVFILQFMSHTHFYFLTWMWMVPYLQTHRNMWCECLVLWCIQVYARLHCVYVPVLRCMCEQSNYSEQYMVGSQQGVQSVDRFNPAGCPGVNSQRGILSSHSHMSPESVRLIHRHRSVMHTDTSVITVQTLICRSKFNCWCSHVKVNPLSETVPACVSQHALGKKQYRWTLLIQEIISSAGINHSELQPWSHRLITVVFYIQNLI